MASGLASMDAAIASIASAAVVDRTLRRGIAWPRCGAFVLCGCIGVS